jgi:N utilization substance protein B
LKLVEHYAFNAELDEDHIRTLYLALNETEEYKTYLAQETTTEEADQKMLLDLYKLLVSHDVFIELSEERFNNWQDDESLVVSAVRKSIKALPTTETFYKEFEPSDETVQEFGQALLIKTCQEDVSLLDEIEPTLKNWDADRVATLDMIMIKMALCELLHFPTIPTKVTLNEFVEISKIYSTEKSKEFINGVLDRLMKKLLKEERIVKEGRGLIE